MRNNRIYYLISLSLLTIIVITACAAEAPAELTDTSVPLSTATEPSSVPEEAAETAPPMDEPIPTEAEVDVEVDTTVSFSAGVLPIMESRCVNCHGGERVEDGLYLRTYDEIMAGSENGAVVIPGNPGDSLLVEVVVTQEMPKRGPKLTPIQVQLLSDWVAAGAPNN